MNFASRVCPGKSWSKLLLHQEVLASRSIASLVFRSAVEPTDPNLVAQIEKELKK